MFMEQLLSAEPRVRAEAGITLPGGAAILTAETGGAQGNRQRQKCRWKTAMKEKQKVLSGWWARLVWPVALRVWWARLGQPVSVHGLHASTRGDI